MNELDTTRDPVLASLERLHERLGTIEARLSNVESRVDALVTPVERAVREAPAALAMVTDVADSFAARIGPHDLDARLSATVALLSRVTEPATLATLERVAGRIDQIDATMRLLDEAPGTVAMVMDSVDALASRVAATGVPLHERVGVVLAAAERLSTPEALEVLELVSQRFNEAKTLLTSGLLDPEAVHVMRMAGSALLESRARGCAPIGPLGALSALREAPVQRALGFTLSFARQFGVALDAVTPSLPAPRA